NAVAGHSRAPAPAAPRFRLARRIGRRDRSRLRLQPETPHARPRADALDPRLDWRQGRLELDAEAPEHHDARREGCVRERELLAYQVLVATQGIAQEVEAPAQLFPRLLDPLLVP